MSLKKYLLLDTSIFMNAVNKGYFLLEIWMRKVYEIYMILGWVGHGLFLYYFWLIHFAFFCFLKEIGGSGTHYLALPTLNFFE